MEPTFVRMGKAKLGAAFHFVPGENVFTGAKPFEAEFGELTSFENDLLNLAAAVYAADLAIKRDERESYIRNIELSVDVVNLDAFELVRQDIEEALQVVTRDNWTIKLREIPGIRQSVGDWGKKDGAVLLFSGGMDSMSGASQFLSDNRELVLVSHNSHGNRAVDECQEGVHDSLKTFFKRDIRNVHLKVFGRNKGKHVFPENRENSQRARSFLFLCLAALVSRRCGLRRVLFMAENGQFAIHLPLNQARVGPFSTHTADPEFLLLMQEIFRRLMRNTKFEITNPYLYMTKAEVFALMPIPLQKESYKSASCWMISRIPSHKHCGLCIPCISRRIAVESNGLFFDEYDFDLFNAELTMLADDHTGKRNLADYLEFIAKFRDVGHPNRVELKFEFCELLSSTFDSEKAIDMYHRVAEQSFSVFKKYPNVEAFAG